MQPGSQQFAIKVATLLRPLFLIMGATRARSQVTVDRDGVHAQFGYYRLTLPGEKIESVERSRWRWYAGLGIRSNFRNLVALVGSPNNIVVLRLDQPVRATMLRIPIKVTRLYLSMDDPDAFIEAVRQRY